MAKHDATYHELVAAVRACGFPSQFAEVLADELGGEWSMRRMIGYLRGAKPSTMEQVADELLAILSHRQAIVEHKMSEKAQAAVTQFYNREREDEDDEAAGEDDETTSADEKAAHEDYDEAAREDDE